MTCISGQLHSSGFRTLSAHILTDDISPSVQGEDSGWPSAKLSTIHYGIAHGTLQLECEGCVPANLYCDITVNTVSISHAYSYRPHLLPVRHTSGLTISAEREVARAFARRRP